MEHNDAHNPSLPLLIVVFAIIFSLAVKLIKMTLNTAAAIAANLSRR